MPESPERHKSTPLAPSLDLTYIEENFINHGFAEMLVEALLIYRDQAASSINSIRQALDASDFDELCHLAHNLKGSSGSVGAAAIAAISEQIEEDLLNHCIDNLPALVSCLQTELYLTVAAIDRQLAHLSELTEPDLL